MEAPKLAKTTLPETVTQDPIELALEMSDRAYAKCVEDSRNYSMKVVNTLKYLREHPELGIRLECANVVEANISSNMKKSREFRSLYKMYLEFSNNVYELSRIHDMNASENMEEYQTPYMTTESDRMDEMNFYVDKVISIRNRLVKNASEFAELLGVDFDAEYYRDILTGITVNSE